MHDGRFATIEEVLDHYNGGFFDGPGVDPLIRARIDSTRSLMRPGQIDTLIAFFHTLTDSSFLTNPDLSNPFEESP
jgi:cytochrome c peroxidase